MKFIFTTLFFLQFSLLAVAQQTSFTDTTFSQEYHVAYPVGTEKGNEVRSIAADKEGNIWIATAAGVLMKKTNEQAWISPFTDTDKGPSFAVTTDKEGAVWMGTWNGVYFFKNKKLQFLKGT
ncbi:MAG: two-component regulator propeller domain-containing protein, partial [Panacibacter sp.]